MSQNVILITIDSLRADHCGFMGYDRNTTPSMDKLAAEGYVFRNAISPGPSTYESMPSIFTGNLLTTFGPEIPIPEEEWSERGKNIRLNMNHETIPEWFTRQGYTTGAFTANPYTGAHTSFARGFDQYEDFMEDGEGSIMQAAAQLPVLSELKHLVTLVRGDRAAKPWTDYYQRVCEWIDSVSEPYFLWVFLLDPHTPYLTANEYRTKTGRGQMYYQNWKLWMNKKWSEADRPTPDQERLVDLYDSAIRAADDFVDHVLNDTREDDPAIIVHADHGEAFAEHDLFGHRSLLYEENIHVPLVVHNGFDQGNSDEPVSLAGVPQLLKSIVHDDTPSLPPRPYALSKTLENRFAVRGIGWKYIGKIDNSGQITDEQIYDLQSDPEEQRNIADRQPDLVDICRRIIYNRHQHEREANSIVQNIEETTLE